MSASIKTDLAWDDFFGQAAVVEQLKFSAQNPVHAYLFVGSTGLLDAAVRFAGSVLAVGADDSDRVVRLAKSLNHPDLIFVEPEGSTLRVSDAQEVIRISSTTPIESSKKVVIISGVDLIEENAIGKLLKVIEEPPASTVFVLLAQTILPEIVTIASRCVQVKFSPYKTAELQEYLVSMGCDVDRAELAAVSSGGSLERAKLLSTDAGLIERAGLWSKLPSKLDGRGAVVSQLVRDVLLGFDSALEPLLAAQLVELEALDKRAEEFGERGSGRSTLVAKHKREARKLRVDELRFGFAILARHFRDVLVSETDESVKKKAMSSIEHIQKASESLIRNPNESLLLQNLFLNIGP